MTSSKRIASIDWMRGFVMIIMVLDHVSMAYNKGHIGNDSAASYVAGSPLPSFEFFTRWISHICAPVFVFLAGTALALSVERKLSQGIDSKGIDKDIFIRGAFIALLDPLFISIFQAKFTFQVLYAIGISMMLMAIFRRFSSTWLIVLALGWMVGGEYLTQLFWPPQDNAASIISALFFAKFSSEYLSISYPVIPWLAVMILGWVFGRFILAFNQNNTRLSPDSILFIWGIIALVAFVFIRGFNDYGNMFLLRENFSWQQWLHVSKYPPSASYYALELGIMAIILAMMMNLEKLIGERKNGVLLVFGQTAMMFYLVHRVLLMGSATYLGLKEFGDLTQTYLISVILLVLLYPFCLWYRGFKARHPNSIYLKYL